MHSTQNFFHIIQIPIPPFLHTCKTNECLTLRITKHNSMACQLTLTNKSLRGIWYHSDPVHTITKLFFELSSVQSHSSLPAFLLKKKPPSYWLTEKRCCTSSTFPPPSPCSILPLSLTYTKPAYLVSSPLEGKLQREQDCLFCLLL